MVSRHTRSLRLFVAVACTAVVLVSTNAIAQDTWEPTGSMGSGRDNHTATLLPNGKVLVTGGRTTNVAHASAEVYDPYTGLWFATGNMADARYGHTSTLLADGRVLVAGGSSAVSVHLASAEIFDPSTGTWSPTGNMARTRSGHTATQLPDGRVLIAAGSNGIGDTRIAEVYDPSTGTWSSTGIMAELRHEHTATLLPDGRVLVAGGRHDPPGSLDSAEVYDPSTGTWSSTDSMATSRADHTATPLPDGRVLVAGGYWVVVHGSEPGTTTYVSSAEVYDPSSNTWSPAGNMATTRRRPTATLLPTGRVLISGGGTGGHYLAEAEVYDPTGGWSPTGSMSAARGFHTATLLFDGRVLVAGGQDDTIFSTGSALASAEVYGLSTAAWIPTFPLNAARYGHSATALLDGRALVSGGHGGSNYLTSAEVYDGGWAATGSMAEARFGHTSTRLADGKVLVVGGTTATTYLASAEVYDPDTGGWSSTGSLAHARYGHTATLLPDGRVLVAGGDSTAFAGPLEMFLTSAEVYEPSTGTWSATGSMGTARLGHTATLLPDGRVLAAGGADGVNFPTIGYFVLPSAEVYDPSTGAWTPTGDMQRPRLWHTATALGDGRVLAVAGANSTSTSEVYDPSTGTWSLAGNLAGQYWQHAAAGLPDGRVLITGARTNAPNTFSTATAELYDPGSGTWSTTDSMGTPRTFHTMTALGDGPILAVGGYNRFNRFVPITTLSSAEVYHAEFVPPPPPPPPPPSPSLSIDNASVTEGHSGTTTALFTVTLSTASAEVVTVDFATSDGTATAGSDYTAAAGTLTFDIGQTTRTIAIPVNGDIDIEPNETFLVTLTNAVNATISDIQGLGTITNDDQRTLAIDGHVFVTEGHAGTTAAVFTVTLSHASTEVVTVNFSTGNGTAAAGSDYTAAAGMLTFVPGDTTETIAIIVHGDLSVEQDESFFVDLNNAINAAFGYSEGLATIVNDDVPPRPLSIDDVAVVEGHAGTTFAVFTVTMSAAYPVPVTVDFQTVDASATAGSDYAGGAGTLTFNPGVTTQTIAIPVSGDLTIEGDEMFAITLANAVNAVVIDGQGFGTIVNDDVPSLSIDDVTVIEGNSGQMNVRRLANTATRLPDGRVLLAGMFQAEVYDPSTNSWSIAGSLLTPRYVHTATLLPDGRVLIAGGWNDVVAHAAAEVFDPVTNTWSATGSMAQGRWDHSATLLNDGRVLVAGGKTLAGSVTTPLASAEIYDPSTGTWSATGSLATPRSEHSAQRVQVGRVVVMGGRNNTAFFTSAEEYDPSTGTWSATGSMSVARAGHVVTRLPGGRALVAGGRNSSGALASAEVYDPATNSWAPTGNMTTPRYWFSGFGWPLPNGTVLVAGSFGSGGLASAEVYDLATGTWSLTGSMSEGRGVHASTQLVDGRVLVAGGRNAIGGRLRSAEVYDASTGTWSSAGAVNAVFTATLSSASPQTVTVDFLTADGTATAGTDYIAGPGTLIFSPGETTGTIRVPVNADFDVEPDETFAVSLSSATHAIIADGQGTGTITNDDEPPVSLSIDTPVGSDVAVSLPPVSVTFDSVTQAGQTQVTTSVTGPASPSGFQLGDPPTYIDLSTTAGFAGSAEVCIDYGSFSYSNETLLRLYHFVASTWTDITSSLDTIANVICGTTTSFSPFAIFEPTEPLGPALTLPGDITAEATSAAGATVDFTATAGHEIDGPVPVACSASAGSTFALGATRVDCSASDTAANTTTGSFMVTVVDTTAPALTLPEGITALATSTAGIAISFATSAVDLVDGTVAVTCSPGSGFIFPIGTTTVSCTAADSRGHQANGSFDVSVTLDSGGTNSPPKLRGLENHWVRATSPAGAAVRFDVWGKDREDGRLPAVCSHQSGDVFPIGLTIVKCTTTDSSGAIDTGKFAVIVIANQSPRVHGLVDREVRATSSAGAAVTFRVWGLDREDGLLPAVCSHRSGAVFPIGVTVVTCTTTDSMGAVGTGSFAVKVIAKHPSKTKHH